MIYWRQKNTFSSSNLWMIPKRDAPHFRIVNITIHVFIDAIIRKSLDRQFDWCVKSSSIPFKNILYQFMKSVLVACVIKNLLFVKKCVYFINPKIDNGKSGYYSKITVSLSRTSEKHDFNWNENITLILGSISR